MPVSNRSFFLTISLLTFAVATLPPRVALYTFADDAFQAQHAAALASKLCYCQLHNYDFILDAQPQSHGRSVHWNRLNGVLALLHAYDWVMYADADVVITNSSVAIDEFLPEAATEFPPFLVLQDGVEVNSGVFIARGCLHGGNASCVRALAFFQSWWEWGYASHRLDPSDQPALMLAVLEAAAPAGRGFDLARHCASKAHYWQLVHCWETLMSRLGRPFGRRSVGGLHFVASSVHIVDALDLPLSLHVFPSETVALYEIETAVLKRQLRQAEALGTDRGTCANTGLPPLHTSQSRRGLNSLNGVGVNDLAAGHHPSQLWAPGHFIVHVTQCPERSQLYEQYTQQLLWQEPWPNCGNTHWVVDPACALPPCISDMWANSRASQAPSQYVMLNRWHGYVSVTALLGPLPPVAPGLGELDLLWDVGDAPHLSLLLAVEVNYELPHPLRHLHAYALMQFRMAPHDDLVSRLFDFISLYSYDWLFFVPLMRAVVANPTLLTCAAPLTLRASVRQGTFLNESLAVVVAHVEKFAHAYHQPVLMLDTSHMDLGLV